MAFDRGSPYLRKINHICPPHYLLRSFQAMNNVDDRIVAVDKGKRILTFTEHIYRRCNRRTRMEDIAQRSKRREAMGTTQSRE